MKFPNHSLLVSIEENAIIGGAGAEIARALSEAGNDSRLLRLGLPDTFIEHGEQVQLLPNPASTPTASCARFAPQRPLNPFLQP